MPSGYFKNGINIGRFKKGQVPWNKGTHPEYMQGENNPFYGKQHSKKLKEKWSKMRIGKKNLTHSIKMKEYYKTHLNPMLGKKHSKATIEKLIKSHSGKLGEKASNWQGGKTSILSKLRNSEQYQKWRSFIFRRDNYTCVECEKVGGKLVAHHIKSFAKHPELRLNIDNGITLCWDCHKKTDNFLWKVCKK